MSRDVSTPKAAKSTATTKSTATKAPAAQTTPNTQATGAAKAPTTKESTFREAPSYQPAQPQGMPGFEGAAQPQRNAGGWGEVPAFPGAEPGFPNAAGFQGRDRFGQGAPGQPGFVDPNGNPGFADPNGNPGGLPPGVPGAPGQAPMPFGGPPVMEQKFDVTGRNESNPVPGNWASNGPPQHFDSAAFNRDLMEATQNQYGIKELSAPMGAEQAQAMQKAIADAVRGNPQLQEQLAALGSHPELALDAAMKAMSQQPLLDRKYLQDNAIGALQNLPPEAKAALANNPEVIGHLARGLEDMELAGERTSSLLGDMASQGSPLAIDMLREKTGQLDKNRVASKAADALSQTPKELLEPQDYQRLATGADGAPFGHKAHEFLSREMKAGNQDALGQMRKSLNGEGPFIETQRVAAQMLGKAGENFQASDAKLLENAAIQTQDPALRRNSVDSLKDVAIEGPHDRGAGRSLGEAADALNARHTGPDYRDRDVRDHANSAVLEAFEKSKGEQSKDALAGYALKRDAIPRELAADAVQRAIPQAKEGDRVATEGLAATLGNEQLQFGQPYVASQAATALGEAMHGGNALARQELNKALEPAAAYRGGIFDPEVTRHDLAARGLAKAATLGDKDGIDDLQKAYANAKADTLMGSRAQHAALIGIGGVGQEMALGDDIGEQARQHLRDSLAAGDGLAAHEIARLGDKVGEKDLRSLFGALSNEDTGWRAGRSLGELAAEAPAERRRQIMDDALKQVTGDNQQAAFNASHVLNQNAADLNLQDVDAIKGSGLPDFRKNALMAETFFKNQNPAVLAETATIFKDAEAFNSLKEADRQKAIEAVAANGDPELKSAVLQHVDSRAPLNQNHIQRFENAYRREVSDLIQDAVKAQPDIKKATGLARLGHLLNAKSMVENGDVKADFVKMDELNAEINTLMTTGETGRQIQALYDKTRSDVLGNGLVQKQEDYLLSQDFRNKLMLSDPNDRLNVVKGEMSKLAALNPDAALKIQDQLNTQLSVMQARENFAQSYASLTPEERQAAIAGAMQGLGPQDPNAASQALGATDKTVGTAGKIQKLIDEFDKQTLNNVTRMTDELGTSAAKHLKSSQLKYLQAKASGDPAKIAEALDEVEGWRKAVGWLDKAANNGSLDAFATTLGLAGLIAGGKPKNAQEWISATNTIAGALGSAHDISKLSPALHAGKLGQMASKVKFLGPLSSAVGVGLDSYNAYQNFSKGDIHSGIGNTGSAIGGAMMMGAPLAGPGAPFVFGAGLALALGGMVWSSVGGWSKEQNYINDLGLH